MVVWWERPRSKIQDPRSNYGKYYVDVWRKAARDYEMIPYDTKIKRLILLLLPPTSVRARDDNNDYNKLNVRTMSMIMTTTKG